MNLIERAKNLWKLSQYEPGQATDETKTPGTEVAMITKKPEKKKQSVFVPRVTRDPVKEIIEQTT